MTTTPESTTTTPTHAPPGMLWVDTETTGLGPHARVIQVGMILTDDEANVLAEASWITYAGPRGWDPKAEEMHRPVSEGGTGLKEAAYQAERSFHQLGPVLLDWLRSHGVDGKTCRPRTGGNGQHFDRDFFRRDLPEVWALFHHRMHDVTALHEVFRKGGMPLHDTRPRPHEALGDLRLAIEHYRAFLRAIRLMATVSPGGIVLGGEGGAS